MKKLLPIFLLILMVACNDTPQSDPITFAKVYTQSGTSRDTVRIGDSAVVTETNVVMINKADTLLSIHKYQVPDVTVTSYKIALGSTVPANRPPVANAGPDQTITLPVNGVLLIGSGSDPDNDPITYKWNTGATTPSLSVSNLTEGTYAYTLTVTDSKGAFATDNVTVTVKPAVVVPPVTGETFQLSFAQRTTDYTRPFAGFEKWIDQWQVTIPNVSQLDEYDRFGWGQLAASKTPLLNKIKANADRGGKFAFGIMTCMSIAEVGWKEAIRYSDGTAGMYPQSVHDAMQASTLKDWRKNNTWIPNWNSPAYLDGLDAFNKDLYNWLNTETYKGRKLKEYISYIDIRGFGDFGEWHMYGLKGSEPTNARESAASLRRIVEAHSKNIPDIWLVALSDGLTNDNSYVPTEISHLLLTGTNQKGKFGIRKDHMGSQYYPSEDRKYNGNNTTYNGQRLGTLFAEGWKTAPYVGEPALGNSNGYAYMDDDITKYHFSVVGNGNYGGVTASNIVAANKVAGYRLTVTGGTLTTNTGAIGLTLNWSNIGNAPLYEDAKVYIELRQGSTVVRSLVSSFNPVLFLPGSKTVTDNFTGLPSGTYDLYLVVKNDYRAIPLSMTSNLIKAGVKL